MYYIESLSSYTAIEARPQTPLEEADQQTLVDIVHYYTLYSNLLATSTFIETPGFSKKKFWNVNFYISHMHVHSRVNLGLFISSAIIAIEDSWPVHSPFS